MPDTLIAKSLADQIYELILNRILTASYHTRQKLSPEELRAEFGVSSTPVRDAIQRLNQNGFLEVQPREGVYVAALDARRAKHVLDVRIALEVLATREAAPRIPTAELNRIAAVYNEAERLLKSTDADRMLEEIDPLLHDLIARYTDNDLLLNMFTIINQQMMWVRTVAGKGAHRYRQAFVEHKEILNALQRRDSDGAAQAMRHHLEETKTTVLGFLQETERQTASTA